MIRITCLSLFMLVCGSITAQQPAAPVSPSQNPQRPTLTNEDLRLQGAADFAARQNVTGQELLSGLEKTQSFRMHCIVVDGEHLDSTVEVVPPANSFRAIYHRGVPGGTIETDQIIFIRPFSYRLLSGATKWQKRIETDDTSSTGKYIFMFFPWIFYAKLKAVGYDQVDGSSALLYEISEYAGAAVSARDDIKVWVRASDGLLLKLVLNNKAGRPRYTITFSDFNQPLTIEPPTM